MVSLAERRRCGSYLQAKYGVSERRACTTMAMNRPTYRHVGKEIVDTTYVRVVSLSKQYLCWGYRKIHALLKREGVRISRERLQVLRKRRKRKVLGTTTQWVNQARYPNHVWSYDFVMDQSDDGRRLKCLTVVDEFTRQGLTVTVGRSMVAGDVIRILSTLFRQHGRPVCLRSDNGPEFIASAVQHWLKKRHVDTHYIAPGSPWQNAYCESFNSIFRTTSLDRWIFTSIAEARVVIIQWLDEYNEIRPHGSLGGFSPEQFCNTGLNDPDNNRRKI